MKIKKSIFLVFVLCNFLSLNAPFALSSDAPQEKVPLPSNTLPTIDGEQFTQISVAPFNPSDRLIEYVREGESFDKWTKLVAYSYKRVPKAGNDPKSMAIGISQILKAANPDAQFQISVNDSTGSVLLDFLTWPEDGSYMEFNVFRLEKGKDGEGICTLQLVKRFPFFSETQDNPVGVFTELRKSWLKQAADFDMNRIQSLFN